MHESCSQQSVVIKCDHKLNRHARNVPPPPIDPAGSRDASAQRTERVAAHLGVIASAVRTLDPSSEAAAERVRGAGRLGVDIPDGALAWLSDLAFDQVCPTPTMRVMPARTSDWCALCYVLAASMELSTIAGRADLGHKLHGLLPHLLFYPLGGLRQNKATVELRRRCQSFLDGNWQQLYD